jgi:hypothetical protein
MNQGDCDNNDSEEDIINSAEKVSPKQSDEKCGKDL